MNNYRQDGKTIRFTAPTGGVVAGDVVVIKSGTPGFIGIAIEDVDAGDEGVANAEGVYELPATAGTGLTFDAGDALYWDATAKKLTKTSTGNTEAGICWKAKAADTATGIVKINAR